MVAALGIPFAVSSAFCYGGKRKEEASGKQERVAAQ